MTDAPRSPAHSGGGRPLRLGTRASRLARWQADWVAGRLQKLGHAVAIVEIATQGDVHRAGPIEAISTQGVFTKAIQDALLAGVVDIAVHSLKDLPTERVDGLSLAAVPIRENPADVLVVAAGSEERGAGSHTSSLLAPSSLLPAHSRVGTGSLRRRAQLLHVRSDLQVANIRGNVETRLAKVDAGEFDAIVLAAAGLNRLGLADRIKHVLSYDVMLPAVGQGALAVECRTDDVGTRAAVAPLNDPTSESAVLAERSLLAQLRGGCLAPIGAWGRVAGGVLKLSAVVLSPDGMRRLAAADTSPPSEAEPLGRRVADALLAQGAASLIAESRRPPTAGSR